MLIDSENDHTRFFLGVEGINAINDGGLGIRYNLGKGFVQFQPGGIRPVLSLEVSPSLIYSLLNNARPNDGGRLKKTMSN